MDRYGLKREFTNNDKELYSYVNLKKLTKASIKTIIRGRRIIMSHKGKPKTKHELIHDLLMHINGSDFEIPDELKRKLAGREYVPKERLQLKDNKKIIEKVNKLIKDQPKPLSYKIASELETMSKTMDIYVDKIKNKRYKDKNERNALMRILNQYKEKYKELASHIEEIGYNDDRYKMRTIEEEKEEEEKMKPKLKRALEKCDIRINAYRENLKKKLNKADEEDNMYNLKMDLEKRSRLESQLKRIS
jgi:hypothetical protein